MLSKTAVVCLVPLQHTRSEMQIQKRWLRKVIGDLGIKSLGFVSSTRIHSFTVRSRIEEHEVQWQPLCTQLISSIRQHRKKLWRSLSQKRSIMCTVCHKRYSLRTLQKWMHSCFLNRMVNLRLIKVRILHALINKWTNMHSCSAVWISAIGRGYMWK